MWWGSYFPSNVCGDVHEVGVIMIWLFLESTCSTLKKDWFLCAKYMYFVVVVVRVEHFPESTCSRCRKGFSFGKK